MSHKSEMAGPFNRCDTIINKLFTFTFYNLVPNRINRCPAKRIARHIHFDKTMHDTFKALPK